MNSSVTEIPQLLTLSQASKRLAVCRRTLERQISAGHLRSFKIGSATRIEVSELIRYLESLRSPLGPQS